MTVTQEHDNPNPPPLRPNKPWRCWILPVLEGHNGRLIELWPDGASPDGDGWVRVPALDLDPTGQRLLHGFGEAGGGGGGADGTTRGDSDRGRRSRTASPSAAGQATKPTPAAGTAGGYTKYRRKQIAELRPYIEGETLGDRVSISASDKEAGSPKPGDMIARNPKNHDDQWLVAAAYFADNFEPFSADTAGGYQTDDEGHTHYETAGGYPTDADVEMWTLEWSQSGSTVSRDMYIARRSTDRASYAADLRKELRKFASGTGEYAPPGGEYPTDAELQEAFTKWAKDHSDDRLERRAMADFCVDWARANPPTPPPSSGGYPSDDEVAEALKVDSWRRRPRGIVKWAIDWERINQRRLAPHDGPYPLSGYLDSIEEDEDADDLQKWRAFALEWTGGRRRCSDMRKVLHARLMSRARANQPAPSPSSGGYPTGAELSARLDAWSFDPSDERTDCEVAMRFGWERARANPPPTLSPEECDTAARFLGNFNEPSAKALITKLRAGAQPPAPEVLTPEECADAAKELKAAASVHAGSWAKRCDHLAAKLARGAQTGPVPGLTVASEPTESDITAAWESSDAEDGRGEFANGVRWGMEYEREAARLRSLPTDTQPKPTNHDHVTLAEYHGVRVVGPAGIDPGVAKRVAVRSTQCIGANLAERVEVTTITVAATESEDE